jgi:hypothetical protein
LNSAEIGVYVVCHLDGSAAYVFCSYTSDSITKMAPKFPRLDVIQSLNSGGSARELGERGTSRNPLSDTISNRVAIFLPVFGGAVATEEDQQPYNDIRKKNKNAAEPKTPPRKPRFVNCR